ncbi:MAG: hypothetical protein WCG02_01110 [Candidatus Taylorbacteria bacterium]
MIYRKHYNTENHFSPQKGVPIHERGMILIDIILALSLSLIFIVVIAQSSSYSRDIFDRAKARNEVLDRYEIDLTNSSGDIYIRPYGNDMIETGSSTIPFVIVRADVGTPIESLDQSALCSEDFTDSGTIGSYDWIQKQAESTSTYSLSKNVTTRDLPLDPSIPLTDLEVRGDTFYISANPNVVSDPDLYVLHLDRSTGIFSLISSINTGPGIAAFALAGKYIYAAAISTAAQLHVIQMDQSQHLSLVRRFKVPLLHATDTPPLGSSIAYHDHEVYLGTEKWVGDEFTVIDITDPATPNKISGMEIGSRVSDIYVYNGTAYMATAGQGQLRLVDVRDPSGLSVIRDFSPSGWQRQAGQSISLFENGLNFGRTSGGYNVTSDHEAFVFSTSSDENLSSYVSTDMPGGVYGIVADRGHTYLISRKAGEEFMIFDRSLSASSIQRFSLPTSPQVMTCYRDVIYVLSKTSPAIYEIRIVRDHHL